MKKKFNHVDDLDGLEVPERQTVDGVGGKQRVYVTPEGVEVRWDHGNNMWTVNSPSGGDGIPHNTSALHQYIMQKQQLQVYPHQQGPYNFDPQQQTTHQQQIQLMSKLTTDRSEDG